MRTVTFDYGQTLGELDTTFLARRAAERGAQVDPARLDAASGVAWAAYDDAKRRGEVARAAWSTFMRTLLVEGGVRFAGEPDPHETEALVAFLWSEQPRRNLWRRPIPGMLELCRDLSRAGVKLGIISNSEGKLLELLGEMGLASLFPVVADSGVLGTEKPAPTIFEWTANELGVKTAELIHVGDAWVADVEGALGVGARALWITREPPRHALPAGVVACGSADAVRAALGAWGVPGA